MRTKIQWFAVLGLVFVSSNALVAYAGDPQADVAARKEAYRKVIIACKNVKDSRTAVHACVKQFHENVQACLMKQGVKPPTPGQKPTDSDIAVMKKCGDDSMRAIK
jgi:hypothetical protein